MSIADVLRHHMLLAGFVAIYFAIAYLLTQRLGGTFHGDKASGIFAGFAADVPKMVFFVLLWRLLHLTYLERDPRRLQTLAGEVRGFLSERSRLIGGLIAAVLMTFMMIAFGQLKHLISVLNPFCWDEFFMQLDRTLHLGILPHVFTHAVFGGHYMISFFTGMYNLWLFFIYFVLLGACFMRPDSMLRMQFLLAFLFTWAVGGNLLATVFSSAGPVYYSELGLGHTYNDLMEILRDHAATGALTVVDTQALLWSLQTRPDPLNGISAFPSMHVASSVLMALFLSRISKLLGRAAIFFATVIMIGSVLLAWHYAVDGYAGGAIAIVCWYASGALVRAVYGNGGSRPVKLSG
jgi:hypothetical protein